MISWPWNFYSRTEKHYKTDNYFISIEGELWPVKNEGLDLKDGSVMSIVSITDGVVSVE